MTNQAILNKHSFYIPVMGIGYTIDTPLKVSQYGIDSVISLIDDILLEKLRKMYCDKFGLPYYEITEKSEDFRAKRITSYLNLINEQAKEKFEKLKTAAVGKSSEIKNYFNMLPDDSSLKQKFKNLTLGHFNLNELSEWVKNHLSIGDINVNIMTKLDKVNYNNDEKLTLDFNDAHAALRGYANSDLESSIILSAGINPRLYGYFEHFNDFYPNENGEIKKKIILKVSDYRSALIQGKFLAKKGLWVSEFRVESGLNCGGHAFATHGYLIGPILATFRDNRDELTETLKKIMTTALVNQNRQLPKHELSIKITAQGGCGTAEEHQFLIKHYKLDSVGWGSPFLLVPEVTNVDDLTLEKLKDAKEDDLYLSNISPLGVPFNNLKGNTKDLERLASIEKGKPGSICTKKYSALQSEFTERGLCIASRQYQSLKLKELDKENLSKEKYKIKYDEIVGKSCICVGLGTSALITNNLDTTSEGDGVSICPGPNMAYFSTIMSLENITDHIYGRANMISRSDRPNIFIKELKVYIAYLEDKITTSKDSMTIKQEKYLLTFIKNLNNGIDYYHNLFTDLKNNFEDTKSIVLNELETYKNTLLLLSSEINTSRS